MTLRLRRVDGAAEAPAALLRWLQLEALPGDVPMETNEGYWWIAYDSEHPVAFAGLTPSQQLPACGYLCRAGVLPSARGRGLQYRLIQIRERHARRLGMAALVTDTYDNPHSGNNLIKAGFRLYAPPVKYGFAGACYWKKALTST